MYFLLKQSHHWSRMLSRAAVLHMLAGHSQLLQCNGISISTHTSITAKAKEREYGEIHLPPKCFHPDVPSPPVSLATWVTWQYLASVEQRTVPPLFSLVMHLSSPSPCLCGQGYMPQNFRWYPLECITASNPCCAGIQPSLQAGKKKNHYQQADGNIGRLSTWSSNVSVFLLASCL